MVNCNFLDLSIENFEFSWFCNQITNGIRKHFKVMFSRNIEVAELSHRSKYFVLYSVIFAFIFYMTAILFFILNYSAQV